tara:strand:+ start:1670 stop:2107 length:438 start_codon:yes stop_codon:yes gene_type:complete
MADEPIDVEPEQIIAEAEREEKPKTINIDAMGADDLVQKEIELTRNKGKFGRFAYNEAKELAAIQRRLYGSPKVNLPKKPMTPFQYSKNMERYAPIMPRNRSRTYGMEVLGKTNMEFARKFDRNKKRQHRRRKRKKSKKDKEDEK